MDKRGKTVLVTLAIGEKYETLWKTYCQQSWEHYAHRHGLELRVITEPIRADTRSPAWQKLALPDVFEPDATVLFVDADVLISRDAANPVDQTPEGRIGVVDEPRGKNYRRAVRLWARKTHIMSNADYYRKTGKIESNAERVFNTGVLVFRPVDARPLFDHVWGTYPETIYYEQPALSHELVSQNLAHPLDEEFNRNWSIDRMGFPFFERLDRVRVDRRNPLHWVPGARNLACTIRFGCILHALENCSFLHLPGGQFNDLPTDWWDRHLAFLEAGD